MAPEPSEVFTGGDGVVATVARAVPQLAAEALGAVDFVARHLGVLARAPAEQQVSGTGGSNPSPFTW